MLRSTLGRLACWLPSQCAVCHAWPSQNVCSACVRCYLRQTARCQTCALPVSTGGRQCGACRLSPPPLDRVLATVAYGFPWDHLITDFKFHGRTGWSRCLASLMRGAPEVVLALQSADCLLPLPLSRQRLQQRGYNQALLLARALQPEKVQPSILTRGKDARAQSSLARSERLAAVRDAYSVAPGAEPLLRDRHILLVDDVMTTGASLHSAAKALRGAGATQVSALVFARTE